MADNVYSISEIVGSSAKSIDDAVRGGISRASQTVRNLDWFEITEIRGNIERGQLGHFQVTMKVGFRLEGREQDEALTDGERATLPGAME